MRGWRTIHRSPRDRDREESQMMWWWETTAQPWRPPISQYIFCTHMLALPTNLCMCYRNTDILYRGASPSWRVAVTMNRVGWFRERRQERVTGYYIRVPRGGFTSTLFRVEILIWDMFVWCNRRWIFLFVLFFLKRIVCSSNGCVEVRSKHSCTVCVSWKYPNLTCYWRIAVLNYGRTW